MLGLTPLGTIHTAISLIAVAAGMIAFIRGGAITFGNRLGRIYIATTVLTCLTGFGIFQHGGFGVPHVLGVLTLAVLAVAAAAARTALFGRASPYVETVGLSTTFFFHMIPGFTETSTRLPRGAPLATGPDDPALQMAIAFVFVLFLVGAALQVWRLRGRGSMAGRPFPKQPV